MALDPGAQLKIAGSRVPWTAVEQSAEMMARAAASAFLTAEFSRQRARQSRKEVGYLCTEHGEKVLSVRLYDHCTHEQTHWVTKSYGHAWCKTCGGGK